jgi:hypothetical protein
MHLEDGQNAAKVLVFRCSVYDSPKIVLNVSVKCVQCQMELDESTYPFHRYRNYTDHWLHEVVFLYAMDYVLQLMENHFAANTLFEPFLGSRYNYLPVNLQQSNHCCSQQKALRPSTSSCNNCLITLQGMIQWGPAITWENCNNLNQ